MRQYNKNIPSFFDFLLKRISRVQLATVDGQPHENIHYQPKKEAICFYLSDVIKLSHEIAHVLEVSDDQKLLQNDYGIKKYFPETEKGKLQALARESRTRGIQSRLVEVAFGGHHLLRFHTLPLDIGSGLGKLTGHKEVLEWSGTVLETAYRCWDLDRIVSTWNRKTIIINDWLESK